jgi:teichuronic acid biosynthesis glycosyltransferase TuaC
VIARLPMACAAPYRPRMEPRLRVLTLTPFYPSAHDPSQGRFISDPLAHMESLGVSNLTIAAQPFYRGRYCPPEDSPAKWTSYFSLPANLGLPTAGEFLAGHLMRTIPRNLQPHGFDLIHAHAVLPCGRAAAILSKRLRIPFVVSVHGLDAFFTGQAGLVFGRWCERVAKSVYASAAAVICVSEKVRRQVLNRVPANTSVIYNGVEPAFFSPAAESRSWPSVLSVGNLIPSKGHALLLRAFRQVSMSVPGCVLEIIGDGPERAPLGQLAAELKISDRVQFHGRQSRTWVRDAMRRCSVFALPSAYEALGCVYLEAMGCAKAAIGCHGQGIDEVIEDGKTGLLIAPGNEDDLTEALHRLLQNHALRRQMGTAARNVILEKFTVGHQVRRLADIYRECAR